MRMEKAVYRAPVVAGGHDIDVGSDAEPSLGNALPLNKIPVGMAFITLNWWRVAEVNSLFCGCIGGVDVATESCQCEDALR